MFLRWFVIGALQMSYDDDDDDDDRKTTISVPGPTDDISRFFYGTA